MNIAFDEIDRLRERVDRCAISCGRDPAGVTIIGVTKTIDASRILKMIDCGIRIAGENRVQEFMEKYPLVEGCEWHMIGTLQKNKVKYLPGKVSLIHSVDSMDLMRELDRRAESSGLIFDVLVELNCAGEGSKSGISPESASEFIGKASAFQNVRIKGLMTIGPNTDDQKQIGRIFENIYKKYIDIQREYRDNTPIECLSMGMSNDFETAIREGSNMIRIGTAIFGRRQ
jgi:pyridoxal phosphate enzyme (YggS family)